MTRRIWDQKEDYYLSQVIQQNGTEDWSTNANLLKTKCETAQLNHRTGKQCRERWYNHLCPDLDKTNWSRQQQSFLFKLHRVYGNKWKQISKHFPGRTDSNIKNKFFSILRKSLRRINKLLGHKGSTEEIREIKPSVMTKILNFIYENETLNKEEKQNLKELPALIFFFSYAKSKRQIRQPLSNFQKEKIKIILQLVNIFKNIHQQQKSLKEGSMVNQEDCCDIQSSEQSENQDALEDNSKNILEDKNVNTSLPPAIISSSLSIQQSGQILKKTENKIATQDSFNENIYCHCSMKFDDESDMNHEFMPFEDPSMEFDQNFEDLIIVGKHIEPINVQQNYQNLECLQQSVVDEILYENFT